MSARVLDQFGNNAIVMCPVCDLPFLVSLFIKYGRRTCPHCGRCQALAMRGETGGMTVEVTAVEG